MVVHRQLLCASRLTSSVVHDRAEELVVLMGGEAEVGDVEGVDVIEEDEEVLRLEA